jgi:hypothetical protein
MNEASADAASKNENALPEHEGNQNGYESDMNLT